MCVEEKRKQMAALIVWILVRKPQKIESLGSAGAEKNPVISPYDAIPAFSARISRIWCLSIENLTKNLKMVYLNTDWNVFQRDETSL